MKESFTVDSINLKSYPLNENDKIIVMYSKEYGLMRAVAKGIKKSKSKLGASMDMMVANKILLSQGKNLDIICQAQGLNSFKNIRNNVDKLFYSIYACEIVINLGIENDPNSKDIYELFYQFLNKVSKSNNKIELMLALIRFQLKMTDISGFTLELGHCINCGQICDDTYFSFEQAGILCKKCRSSDIKTIKIHRKIKDFFEVLLLSDFDSKTKYDKLADEFVCNCAFDFLKKYLQFHCPKRFKSIDILEKIK